MNATHNKLLSEVRFINMLLKLNEGAVNSFSLDNEQRGPVRRYQLNVNTEGGISNTSDWLTASEMRLFIEGVVCGISRYGWIINTKSD